MTDKHNGTDRHSKPHRRRWPKIVFAASGTVVLAGVGIGVTAKRLSRRISPDAPEYTPPETRDANSLTLTKEEEELIISAVMDSILYTSDLEELIKEFNKAGLASPVEFPINGKWKNADQLDLSHFAVEDIKAFRVTFPDGVQKAMRILHIQGQEKVKNNRKTPVGGFRASAYYPIDSKMGANEASAHEPPKPCFTEDDSDIRIYCAGFVPDFKNYFKSAGDIGPLIYPRMFGPIISQSKSGEDFLNTAIRKAESIVSGKKPKLKIIGYSMGNQNALVLHAAAMEKGFESDAVLIDPVNSELVIDDLRRRGKAPEAFISRLTQYRVNPPDIVCRLSLDKERPLSGNGRYLRMAGIMRSIREPEYFGGVKNHLMSTICKQIYSYRDVIQDALPVQEKQRAR